MAAALEISVASPALVGLEARLRRLAAGMADLRPVLEALGTEVESQTRRRLSEEKTSPNGETWRPWADAYTATRHAGHGLLQSEGHLLDSIQSLVRGDLVEVGSNLVYAAIHQFGGTADMAPGPAAVPAREYLGLSADNEADLDAILTEHFDGLIGEALA